MGVIAELPVLVLIVAAAITLAAGFIKGAVGFAMPMVMISGLSTFLPADLALAALILPTLASNGLQAFRQGGAAVWESIKRFRLFLGIALIALIAAAQLYRFLPAQALFALIGVPVCVFSLLMLIGWQPRVEPRNQTKAELAIGTIAGAIGGVSGVWGPPTVLYLTAISTPKADQMRIQGVIYGLGSVALLLGHMKSGVMNATSAPLSALLLVPAMLGMWVGLRFHDRLDAQKFRKLTLLVLLVAGANLIRKAVFI